MNHRRLLLSPLWFLIALITVVAGGTASAAAHTSPETRVRAIDHVAPDDVAAISSERPASVGCVRPETAGMASASSVATEAARQPPARNRRHRRAGYPDHHNRSTPRPSRPAAHSMASTGTPCAGRGTSRRRDRVVIRDVTGSESPACDTASTASDPLDPNRQRFWNTIARRCDLDPPHSHSPRMGPLHSSGPCPTRGTR